MEKIQFYDSLKEIFEIDETLDQNTNLTDLPEFDSLSKLAIIAFVDENFSKKITAEQLNSITTVNSLMETIGIENFKD